MPNEPELQIDALDYEIQDNQDLQDTGDSLSGLEQDLSVSGLDSFESDNEQGSLNIPLIQIFTVSPLVILAATSIIRPESTIMNITATVGGGAVTLTSNPQIATGINGQLLILRGSHATDTITLDDDNGVKLAGNCTLALNDTLTLYYDGLITNMWIELSRSTNG